MKVYIQYLHQNKKMAAYQFVTANLWNDLKGSFRLLMKHIIPHLRLSLTVVFVFKVQKQLRVTPRG